MNKANHLHILLDFSLPDMVEYDLVTIFHLSVKIHNTFVTHNNNCNIFGWLNDLPLNSL